MWGGTPDLDERGQPTGWTIITADGLAELGGYVLAVRQWMAAAEVCLGAIR